MFSFKTFETSTERYTTVPARSFGLRYLLHNPLANQLLDVRAPQEVVGVALKVDVSALWESHQTAALDHAHLDVKALGRFQILQLLIEQKAQSVACCNSKTHTLYDSNARTRAASSFPPLSECVNSFA